MFFFCKKTIKFTFIVLSLFTFSQNLQLLNWRNHDDLFYLKMNSKLFACLFFNSSTTNKQDTYLDFFNLVQTKLLSENISVNIILFDYYNSTDIALIHSLFPPNIVDFYFSIQNQYIEYIEDFKNTTVQKVVDFIIKNTQKIFLPLPNFEELTNFNNRTIICVYIGKKNPNFEQTKNLAFENIQFDFYYELNLDRQSYVAQILDVKFEKERDYFLILKNIDKFSDIDTLIAIYNPIFFWNLGLQYFLDYNKLPKYKDERFQNDCVFGIHHRNQPFVLLLRSENDFSEKFISLKSFKKAVKILPNKMNFLAMSFKENDMSPMMHVFMNNKLYPNNNSLYVIYRQQGIIQIDLLSNSKIGSRKIVELVQNFSQKHHDMFIQDNDPLKKEEIKSFEPKNDFIDEGL